MNLIGVIADTHGLLRENALAALTGSDLIIHAGDIGDGEVLEALEKVAPVSAVRGNMDKGVWAHVLPTTDVVEVAGHYLYVLHIEDELDLVPEAAGFSAVISGHTHHPEIRHREGVLYLNPRSAGPRRFDLPVTLATIRVEGDSLSAEIIQLAGDS